MNLSDQFREHAQACGKMGSSFTYQLLNVTAAMIDEETTTTAKLLKNWQGDARGNAGNLPLRFAGALHNLVLTGAPELAGRYPPQETSDHDLAHAVEYAVRQCPEHFARWLQSAPQTNEIQRSAILIAAGHMIAAHSTLPLALSELGASGGLNLQWDKYALDIQGEIWRQGNATPALTLSPEWSGVRPVHSDVQIPNRSGVDLNPLDPKNKMDKQRLQSYIWPDQIDRLERLDRAAPIQSTKIDKEDAALWVENRLSTPMNGQAHLIYHTVFWQYLPQESKARIKNAIHSAANRATTNAPLYWLSFEEDQSGQPGGSIDLQYWPIGKKINLGRADFHARWINWAESTLF